MEVIEKEILEVERCLYLAGNEGDTAFSNFKYQLFLCARTNLSGCIGITDEFKNLKRKLDDLDKTIVRAVNKIQYISEAMDDTKTQAILDWVSTIQYRNYHEEHISRMENSGEWLLNHKKYREWRRASYSSSFWLSGIGKLCH